MEESHNIMLPIYIFTKSTLSTMKKQLLYHILLKEHGIKINDTDNIHFNKLYLIEKIIDLQHNKTSQEYVQHELNTIVSNNTTTLTLSKKKEEKKELNKTSIETEPIPLNDTNTITYDISICDVYSEIVNLRHDYKDVKTHDRNYFKKLTHVNQHDIDSLFNELFYTGYIEYYNNIYYDFKKNNFIYL